MLRYNYSDFISKGGTQNVDMFGLIFMIKTLFEALGNSILSSLSKFISENNHLIRSLRLFRLDTEEETRMTDDGSTYHIIEPKLGKAPSLHEALSQWSFLSCFRSARKALIFKKDMMHAIYRKYSSQDTVSHHFILCESLYGHSQPSSSAIHQLKNRVAFVSQT